MTDSATRRTGGLAVGLFALAGFAAVASLRALWSYLQFGGRIGM